MNPGTTEKKKAFARHVFDLRKRWRAAELVGYTGSRAVLRGRASKLMRDAIVISELERLNKAADEASILTRTAMTARLARMICFDFGDLINDKNEIDVGRAKTRRKLGLVDSVDIRTITNSELGTVTRQVALKVPSRVAAMTLYARLQNWLTTEVHVTQDDPSKMSNADLVAALENELKMMKAKPGAA